MVPTVVVSLLTTPIAGFESVGIPLKGQFLKDKFKNYVFLDGIKILIIDLVAYTLVGIYIDNIMPRKTGMQRPWHYVCDLVTPTYWDCYGNCRKKSKYASKKESDHKI